MQQNFALSSSVQTHSLRATIQWFLTKECGLPGESVVYLVVQKSWLDRRPRGHPNDEKQNVSHQTRPPLLLLSAPFSNPHVPIITVERKGGKMSKSNKIKYNHFKCYYKI